MGKLKAPFPQFGGKSRVASTIWDRFGDVPNYVEPFAGSLAVLLGRPTQPKTETVNDLNGFLTCFWRSVKADPLKTSEWAFNPVSECDILARHKWLMAQREELTERMKTDPDYYDPKVAGWWVWGASCWIGSGWCVAEARQLPHLGDAGRGVVKKLPHLGNAGRGGPSRDALDHWFLELQHRLIRVRIACGDWARVLGPSVTEKHGLTAIFLDPPYSLEECEDVYGMVSPSAAVSKWAIENGNNPLLRICLAGYEGEHDMPDSWECVAWKAAGGMGSQGEGRGRSNSGRDRLWFSPACLKMGLFGDMEGLQ